MNRRTARETALQILFQMDVGKISVEDAYENLEVEKDVFLEDLVFGTVKHLDEIDSLIEAHLENWTISRLANVDRNILRYAVYELKFVSDIPSSVTINEAVEVAKRFGDDQSSKFINGVLSKIQQSLEK
jgi:transcription antitermination protein NusB